MTETLKLPPRLDLSAAQQFLTDVSALNLDAEVVLDAGDVTHFGAICVQTVLAAATRAKTSGATLRLENVSERVEEQLGHMGLSCELLMEGRA